MCADVRMCNDVLYGLGNSPRLPAVEHHTWTSLCCGTKYRCPLCGTKNKPTAGSSKDDDGLHYRRYSCKHCKFCSWLHQDIVQWRVWYKVGHIKNLIVNTIDKIDVEEAPKVIIPLVKTFPLSPDFEPSFDEVRLLLAPGRLDGVHSPSLQPCLPHFVQQTSKLLKEPGPVHLPEINVHSSIVDPFATNIGHQMLNRIEFAPETTNVETYFETFDVQNDDKLK